MVGDRRSGKLAVILHADIAGSTALVQQDETFGSRAYPGYLSALQQHYRKIQRSSVRGAGRCTTS